MSSPLIPPEGTAVSPAENRLLLLGTGTCQIEAERTTSAVLVEQDDLRLVYDFGRGTAGRLAGLGLRQDDVEHVVLSHFHPDHISDLIPYLHGAAWSQIDPRRKDLHVYGPIGLTVQMMRLLSLFGPDTLERLDRYRVHLHEIRGDELVLTGRDGGEHRFAFGDLPPASNRGLKWTHNGKTYALTGDSDFHEKEVEFLQGVDLAVIDAGHPSDDEIVELAIRTQADQLICSHLYRPLDAAELQVQAARQGYKGRLQVGHDLMSFLI